MAVKLMVAPAIAKGELAKPAATRKKPGAGEQPRAKRRRSSVYDAEGNEVFITLMCLKCHKMRPLSLFGLRKMADGAIRNQPWCRSCRSGTADKAAKDSPEIVESPVAAESPAPAEAGAEKKPRRSGAVAAEVAAALAAGRG